MKKIISIFLIISIIELYNCEPPSLKHKNGPLIFTNWPPSKSSNNNRQYLPPSSGISLAPSNGQQSHRPLIVQIRSGTRPSLTNGQKRPILHIPKRYSNNNHNRPIKFLPSQLHSSPTNQHQFKHHPNINNNNYQNLHQNNNNNNNNNNGYQQQIFKKYPNNFKHNQHQYKNQYYFPSSTTTATSPSSSSSDIHFPVVNSNQFNGDSSYTYENPFVTHNTNNINGYHNINSNNNNNNYNNIIPSTPIETTSTNDNNIFHITTNNDDYSPIHTIPAPNLSGNQQYSSSFGNFFNTEPIDNHISETPLYPPLQSPTRQSYQVTEPTNDHTLRNPITGNKQYYAPDPDPSLPAYKIRPITDPYSQPSNYNELPLDVNYQAVQLQQTAGSPHASASAYAIQLAQPIGQQQLPDSYGLPLANQPQLQHFLQTQHQNPTYQAMTSAVHNPTYLVTQSNQLFNQHQQHLFKPDTQLNQFGMAASAGQLYAAAKDTFNHFEQDNKNQNQNNEGFPQFAALVDNNNDDNNDNNNNNGHYSESYQSISTPSTSHSQTLSHQEYSNLINYGNINGNTDQQQQQQQQDQHQGFIVSSYYGGVDGRSADLNEYVEPTNQQLINQETITHANQELLEQQQQYYTPSSAHEEHDKLLKQQFDGEGFNIYVPDGFSTENKVSSSLTFGRRSDNFNDNLETDNLRNTLTTASSVTPTTTTTTTQSTDQRKRKQSIAALRQKLENGSSGSSIKHRRSSESVSSDDSSSEEHKQYLNHHNEYHHLHNPHNHKKNINKNKSISSESDSSDSLSLSSSEEQLNGNGQIDLTPENITPIVNSQNLNKLFNNDEKENNAKEDLSQT